ncbi:hypothetical protein QBC46DRAFT_386141 [Diplogelasinospora grovesii]|uniref:Fungal N-terminal domain-containing protein n=1 Tax=Diplogelasinospora grovesii TaxID=303347 RepID=A0AAN6N8K2_9PEZI|nr:hypothetical protein QBC46DRAFT_386141 [Diplogelasinospora grovesii]
MDPITVLSVVGKCFSLAGSILAASKAIKDFAKDVKDATKDLDAIANELGALSPLLSTIANNLSTPTGASRNVSEAMLSGLLGVFHGCQQTISEIEGNITKYRETKIWTSSKWALYGKDETKKSLVDLERYKSALGIGLHVFNMYEVLSIISLWLGY